MKTKLISLLLFALVSRATFAVTISVPGTAHLWLAGMPDGSTASFGDSAPGQSPVLVVGIPVFGGAAFRFSASGSVSRGDPLPFYGPDGESEVNNHWSGDENGIANLNAPLESLIGVFLGPGQPNLNPPPAALDFTTPASRDYLTLSPALQQPFFIGDGLTSLAAAQQVIAPDGATRLYLGTMDEYEWSNNLGSFTVNVVPEPGSALLGLAGLVMLWLRRASRNNG